MAYLRTDTIKVKNQTKTTLTDSDEDDEDDQDDVRSLRRRASSPSNQVDDAQFL